MARRRRGNKQAVSLFPFLSILACVIGTLTLMITGLALSQMDNEVVDSGLKLDYLKREIRKNERFIEKLKEKLAGAEQGAGDTLKKLADALVELERLKREKESLFAKLEEDPEEPDLVIPTVDTDAHKKRMAQIQQELLENEELRKKLRAELAQRKMTPGEAEVIIQPSGSGVDLDPIFSECTSTGIVVYHGDEPWRVRRADLSTDERLGALLDDIATRPNASLILLVRDNGLSTYNAASAVARAHYARNGKLPVIGQGKIDLSLFKK